MRHASDLPPRAIARALHEQGVRLRNAAPDAATVSYVLDNCRRRLRADAGLGALLRGERRLC
jgi:hypothetical protein